METAEKILKTIQESIDKFQTRIPELQNLVYKELLPLLKELDVKNGNLLNNLNNLKALGDIKNKVERIIITGKYKEIVKDFIESFTQLSNLNNQYFWEFNNKYKPKNTLPIIKQLAVEATINSLIGQGMHQSVLEPVSKIINQNITTGGSYADFQEQIRKHITKTQEGEGFLEKYTKQITTDAINQYNAQYHEAVAADLRFNWGRYIGSNLTTTRQFCELLTYKEWVHRSELPEIIMGVIDGEELKLSRTTGLPLGMIPGTNSDNFKIRRGGYNCGHQFFWVPDSAVPEHVKRNLTKPAGEKVKYDIDVLKKGKIGRLLQNSALIKALQNIHPELQDIEKVSVYGYSDDEYYDLNKILRGEKKGTGYYENYRELLNESLGKMTTVHDGWVFRGTKLPSHILDTYKRAFSEKGSVEHKYYTSTSAVIDKSFAGNTRMSIKSKTGVFIKNLSMHQPEEEVLFKAGTNFKVLHFEEKEGIAYIKLEEL